MSTDYNAVCDTCRVRIHIGQRMGFMYSFGHGSRDLKGQGKLACFIFEGHVDKRHAVRLELADVECERPSDRYTTVDDDDLEPAVVGSTTAELSRCKDCGLHLGGHRYGCPSNGQKESGT